MQYRKPSGLDAVLSGAIAITGPARSGTSIIGKLIASCEGVEYAYEPPELRAMLAVRKETPDEAWRFMYERWLYDCLLMDGLAGRYINCNQADESSVFGYKLEEEVNARLASSLSKVDAAIMSERHRCCFKLPDAVSDVIRLGEAGLAGTVLCTMRAISTNLQSLYRKGWFATNEASQEDRIWPLRANGVPYWLTDGLVEQWVAADEVNKCGLYLANCYKAVLIASDVLIVDYDRTVKGGRAYVDEFLGALNLKYGRKTAEILESLGQRPSSGSMETFAKLGPSLRDELECLHREMQARAI